MTKQCIIKNLQYLITSVCRYEVTKKKRVSVDAVLIARDDRKQPILRLEVDALLDSALPRLEAPLELLLPDGSQSACRVLLDVLNPL